MVQLENIPEFVGNAALALHKTQSEELTLTLDSVFPPVNTDDYEIVGKSITFSSLASRNLVASRFTYNEYKDAINSSQNEWLSIALDLWVNEIGRKDTAAGRLLGLVHQKNNILELAISRIQSRPKDVFDVLHVLQAALPYIEVLDAGLLIKVTVEQRKLTQQDMAGGLFYNSLSDHLKPDICRELRNRLIAQPDRHALSLYPVSLLVLARHQPELATELVLLDTEHQNQEVVRTALFTLTRQLRESLVPDSKIHSIHKLLLEQIANPSQELSETVKRSTANLIFDHPEFSEAFTDLCLNGDAVAISSVINALFAERKLDKECLVKWLTHLSSVKIDPGDKYTLDLLDHLLCGIVKQKESLETVINFFNIWLPCNAFGIAENFTDVFDSTSSALVKDSNATSKLITLWFISSHHLCAAAADLLKYLWVHKKKHVQFSKEVLDTYDQQDLLLLIRRVLGYVLSEDQLLALTFSLLQTEDAKTRVSGFVENVLVEQIGIDYPSSTVEGIESKLKDPLLKPYKKLLKSAVNKIKKRMDELEQLEVLEELKSSATLHREFLKGHNKLMSETMEGINKKSVFRQLVTNVPVKGGVGFFSFHDDALPDAAPMHSISEFVSMPRRDSLDSVGFEITRLMFRNAKKDQ